MLIGIALASELTMEDRVSAAIKNVDRKLTAMYRAAGIKSSNPIIYIRAFKREADLEVWAANAAGEKFKLLASYDVAAQSGVLGPKRKEGDKQVPEGFYVIDRFNPQSRFHLSLGINYPNASDRILSDKQKPGGDIFIHGDRKSIGCLAMTDPIIEEIYVLALRAKQGGQKQIRVDIFPFRMTSAATRTMSATYPDLAEFWRPLAAAYRSFESSRLIPQFKVLKSGAYEVSSVRGS